METIREYQEKKLKKYYGASKKVYQRTHIKRVMDMLRDCYYLGECFTRCRLTPCNEEFLHKKAIPIYNETLEKMKLKYPNIKDFHDFKPF